MAPPEDLGQQIQATIRKYVELEERLRGLEANRFRVCVFGSARIRSDDPTYRLVYDLARALAEREVDVITGGGPGLMEAANRAVQDVVSSASQSIGLPIMLPRAREIANRHLDIKSEHQRFSSRLDEFMALSHAVVVAPGGIGTLLELMYVWQLIQVGMIEHRAVILLGTEMWAGLLEWMRRSVLGRGFVAPGDFAWVHCVDTVAQAMDVLDREIAAFSGRHVAANVAENAAVLE